MKPVILALQPKLSIVLLFIVAAVLVALPIQNRAQGSQLSLADILVALRSKKVTLNDRNKILTEAINTRGTTFTLTPEIEKELAVTGADKALLDSIRRRPQIAKVAAVLPPPADPKQKVEPPKAEPPTPVTDLAFYEKRAAESLGKGDLDAALADYTKAVESDGSSVAVRMARGDIYLAKKAYVLAIADFTKVIELEPTNALAFAHRAEANEKQGDAALAVDDNKKAFALDPTIESAKHAVERYNAEQAKLNQKPEPEAPPVTPAVRLPEFVDLGQISESRATRMMKPLYPQSVRRAGIGGQVVVDIELDVDGNVTKATVVSGSTFLRQPSQEAALKSKFKPAMIGDKAVKAKARVVYSFIATH